MRITVIAILLCSFSISLRAQDSGNLRRKYMDGAGKKMSLMDIFREIQMQTGFMFVFQPTLVDLFESLPTPRGRVTVEEFLNYALVNTPVGFEENGRNIIIFRKPVFFEVSGKVVEFYSNEPLPGVTIIDTEDDKTYLSGETGEFNIRITKGQTLKFSSPGMLHTQLTVEENKPGIVIRLRPILLDTVVINTGYYKIRTSEQTGNIIAIGRSRIEDAPVTNPLQVIQGRVPGIFLEQLSGVPGAGFRVRIRGDNFLRESGNEPLFIIDGMPIHSGTLSSPLTAGEILPASNPLNSIPPELIESIEILKDADGTAIYGSRGANGVVLITTRTPKATGYKIDLEVARGVSQVPHFITLLNTPQWLEMRKEAFANDNVKPKISTAPDLLLWDTTRYTDWQKTLLSNSATVTEATATLQGGEGGISFMVSQNINKQTLVFPGDFSYTRSTTHLSFRYQSPDKKLTLNSTANYSTEKSKLPPVDLTQPAMYLAPVAPNVYTSEHDLNWEGGTWHNPMSYVRNVFLANGKNLLGSVQLQYRLSRKFSFIVNSGISDFSRKEHKLEKISAQNPGTPDEPRTGNHAYSDAEVSSWIVEPQLDFETTISEGGKFRALVGTSLQRSSQNGTTYYGYGYTNDGTLPSIQAAPNVELLYPLNAEYGYGAVYARFNYNHIGKYIVNVAGRRDASSRFAGGKASNFGSVAAAWVFTREKFALNWKFLETGKLRVSYGITGNDQIGDYGYLDSYTTSDFTYSGRTGIYPSRVANPTYSWEMSTKFEPGLLLAFFKNKLQFEISYYRNLSSRQLLGYSLPSTTGFETVQYNMPVTVRNTGFELLLQAYPANGKLRWSSSFNITIPRSKLIKYDNLDGSVAALRYTVGQSADMLKQYKYLGVDPATGNYLYEDVDGDKRYTTTDLQVTSVKGVTLYGGLENVFNYGNFQLSFLIQFVNQNRPSFLNYFDLPGSGETNQPVDVMGRWQRPGDVSGYHKFTQSPAGQREYNNARSFGENTNDAADYVRLRNVQVQYKLPIVLTSKVNVSSTAIYCAAQNVFTVTDYFGLDPENANPLRLPPLRTITLGMKIGL